MNDLILSQMRQRLEILYQMVDELERGGGGGGSDDSYTKAQTDALLSFKADKSTTYTKTQTDNLLSAKANKSTTYTKTEVDTALAEKANASTTYTKTEVNTALAAKADKTDTYTKTQTDNLLNLKANTSYVNTVKDTADTANALAVDNRAALIELVDGGAKNKLLIGSPTSIPAGLTCVRNSDGTYTVSGTLTSANSISFSINAVEGDLVLSGCPEGGGNDTYLLRITKSGSQVVGSVDTGNGSDVFTMNGTGYALNIRFGAGTYTNVIFSPMICTKADWDISQTYQSYRPTYQELYEMVLALQPTT